MMNALVWCVVLCAGQPYRSDEPVSNRNACKHLAPDRLKELKAHAASTTERSFGPRIKHRHLVKVLRRWCTNKGIALDANTKRCLSVISKAALFEEEERERLACIRAEDARREEERIRKQRNIAIHEEERARDIARRKEEEKLYPPHVTDTVRVHVDSATVGNVDFTVLGELTSIDHVFLKLVVSIANTTEDKKLNYFTWDGERAFFWGFATRDFATLTDDIGNDYKRVYFGFGVRIHGRIDDESIYPGQTIADLLVFERPVAKAKVLTLELPAANFGGEGLFQLKMPTSRIKRD